MDSFGIGISGLNAAQTGFDIIGNNIANAATEGYHRQRLNLTPSYTSQVGSVMLGGGVDIAGITRMIDDFLQQEIFRQQSSLEQLSQEADTLRTVESSFGELADGSGLSTALDDFFNALQDLSAHPAETIWQNQAVSSAQTLAAKFRTLGQFLTTLETQISLQAENVTDQINVLTDKIAELNGEILRQEINGGQAYNLRDQRDQYTSELSKLVGVQTESRDYGVVDVSTGGTPVVIGTSAFKLDAGISDELGLGISVAGDSNYNMDIQGGTLGALLSLKNDLIAGIHGGLDKLARAIIQQINQCHAQGIGTEGPFTELTGFSLVSENLADFDPPVSDGSIYIRLTNTSTGEVTRSEVPIDASADSLTSIAAAIAAITGLTASVYDSRLHIQAETNYTFDFLPCVLPTPVNSDFTGAASPPAVSVSGTYAGTENQTFTFTVSGTGSIGNGTLDIIVTNGDGDTVTTLNAGAGYAAGDKLDIGNGIKIALGTGDMADGNTFTVDAFVDTDTSGLLAAAGINAFFSGSDASSIAVCPEISAEPARIATALNEDAADNNNVLRMVALKDQAIDGLGGLTAGEYYRRLITDIGRQVSVKQTNQENVQALVLNLTNQQSETSGVNINDEAAQLLIFERMFKAMAKYLSTLQSSLSTVMEII
jgi:flagellar hook-associated protein 1 FlgK